jgi:glycosyltransferase involved in cell wall biosynthesis
MRKLVLVGDRSNDHSPSSGYDPLCSVFPDAGWLSGKALEAGDIRWHRPAAEKGSDYLFHVIYGDCSGKALPSLLRARYPGSRIVSSLHRPTALIKEDSLALAAVELADVLITVSEVQATELRRHGFSAPIHAIPHGVWTGVFRPAEASSTNPHPCIMMIGSFLRDWEGAKRVLEILSRAGVRTFALGAGARDKLSGTNLPPQVEVLQRVSESRLAELYQHSAAVFLPFLEATASNALLEAMAAGCPVICPRFPSLIDEYLGDDSDSFSRGEYEVAASRLLHYTRTPTDRRAKAQTLMAKASAFDWTHVRERFVPIYAELASS